MKTRTHTPVDRARITRDSIRGLGLVPTVAQLMRSVRDLRRSEAEAVIAEPAGPSEYVKANTVRLEFKVGRAHDK